MKSYVVIEDNSGDESVVNGKVFKLWMDAYEYRCEIERMCTSIDSLFYVGTVTL